MKLDRHLGHRRLVRYFIICGKQLSLDCISLGATNMPKEFSLVEKSTGG
jgi:hypothetical protein